MTEHIKGVGEYDNLNKSQPIEIGDGVVITDLDAFADKIVEANYGVHRLLSAIIRARKRSGRYEEFPDKLGEALTKLLEDQHY